jgi:hypothetical protein
LADGTAGKVIWTAQPVPCSVTAILVTNINTVVATVNLLLVVGGSAFDIGSVTVPIGAGTGGAAAVELLSTLLGANQNWLPLDVNVGLQMSLSVALTGTNAVVVTCLGGSA